MNRKHTKNDSSGLVGRAPGPRAPTGSGENTLGDDDLLLSCRLPWVSGEFLAAKGTPCRPAGTVGELKPTSVSVAGVRCPVSAGFTSGESVPLIRRGSGVASRCRWCRGASRSRCCGGRGATGSDRCRRGHRCDGSRDGHRNRDRNRDSHGCRGRVFRGHRGNDEARIGRACRLTCTAARGALEHVDHQQRQTRERDHEGDHQSALRRVHGGVQNCVLRRAIDLGDDGRTPCAITQCKLRPEPSEEPRRVIGHPQLSRRGETPPVQLRVTPAQPVATGFPQASGVPKKSRIPCYGSRYTIAAFFHVTSATSATSIPFAAAIAAPTTGTRAGRFGFPR